MLAWGFLYFGIGLAGTWLARRYAMQRNLFDHPGARRSHLVATPRGGGLSIVVALLMAAIALAVRDPQQRTLLVAFAVGLTLVAGIGMLDDHHPLSPWLRLVVHASAALLLALAIDHVFADMRLAAIAFVAALVLTNVWNFMDGINGLAATQALLLVAVIACIADGAWSLLAIALAAASLGFLPYNFPTARIFLGDVGSGAMGFAIAALGVTALDPIDASSWLLMLPLSAFLLDAGLTLLRRMLRGERWWAPHTQHAYQVLARRAGHTAVTVAYGFWTLLGWAIMLGLREAPPNFMLSIGIAWYISGAFLWWLLQRLETRAVSVLEHTDKDSE
jgi:UDP-N-acetylmuramyl pentapeptide phosphotransferase/UDP-N-acetylglucosamine-1-phosphate transferase